MGHWMNEADIGSGEKSPAQLELEAEQRKLGEERRHGRAADAAGQDRREGDAESRQMADDGSKVLQSGDHLARVTTKQLEDGTYEAQVYVRLTREPELAETYIPAGTYPDEAQAQAAAEERARRALEEQEF
ncbi:MAG TPA: hypothetical protein VIG66_05050 [Noviherbaspirillum sp.]